MRRWPSGLCASNREVYAYVFVSFTLALWSPDMVHFDSTMIIVRRQGDDHLIQGYLHSGGNALVQLSRMVLEKGRLRRPERFLQFLRMVHFRRKCTMRKNCRRDVAEAASCGIIEIGYLKNHGKGEMYDREP